MNNFLEIILVVVIALATVILPILKSIKKAEKEERIMQKELKYLHNTLKAQKELFDCISGYEEFLKFLVSSIDWLDGKHLNKSLENFQNNFKCISQTKFKPFLISCLTLYPAPYFNWNSQYFGKFQEVEFLYEKKQE